MKDQRLVAGSLVVVCALAYAFSLLQLSTAMSGVAQQYYPDDTPVLVLTPSGPVHGTVVVAHGFAANIGMMKPLGYYLAQNGYRVVLFDFPGYGNSRLRVNATGMEDTLGAVCTRYGGDNYSLAGHSLGSYAVLSYGMSGHGEAVVGLSSFYSEVNRTSPRNMLLIAGAGDMPSVVSSLPAAVANGTGVPDPQPGVLYGSFADGTAREYRYVDANHITILFSAAAYNETVGWLRATYGEPGSVSDNGGGIPLAWAFVAIGSALIALLPGLYLLTTYVPARTRSLKPPADRHTWRPMLAGLAGCLLAAIAVNVFDAASFTGLTMADLLIGFLLYAGVFALAIGHFTGYLVVKGWRSGAVQPILLALAVGILLIVAIAVPMNMAFYEQPTTPGRLLLMALVALLTLPFFVAGDALARGVAGWRSLAYGAGFRAVALALAALAFAASGNLFFDLVILPVVAPLFLGLEVVSFCAYRWTGSIFAGAFVNALITGWLLASAFPIA